MVARTGYFRDLITFEQTYQAYLRTFFGDECVSYYREVKSSSVGSYLESTPMFQTLGVFEEEGVERLSREPQQLLESS